MIIIAINRFIVIINFCNRFDKALTETFQFCRALFYTAFMCLQFGFLIFQQKEIWEKAALNMLMKLTAVVSFTFLSFKAKEHIYTLETQNKFS